MKHLFQFGCLGSSPRGLGKRDRCGSFWKSAIAAASLSFTLVVPWCPSHGALTFVGNAEGTVWTDAGGLTRLEFLTAPGYQYTVLANDDLTASGWSTHSSHYGFGQTVSMIVKQSPASGGGGSGGLPFDVYHSGYFFLHAFSNGTSLASFTHEGTRLDVLVQEDFTAVGSLPIFVGHYDTQEPDPANPGAMLDVCYSVSTSTMTGVWQAAYTGPAYDPTSLTPDQAAYLAILTDRVAQVRTDMIAAAAGQNAPPPTEPPPSNVTDAQKFFLLEVHAPDSDGDGIPDAIEYAFWNGSAFLADSDGDGVSDAWDAYPLDPSAWQFVPGDPNDHDPPAIVLTAPTHAVPQP